MISNSKRYGLVTALLVLGCAAGIYAMLLKTPENESWPEPGAPLPIVVSIPNERSAIFLPKVQDASALQTRYGNVVGAKSRIHLDIQSAYAQYEKHALPPDSTNMALWKEMPIEQKIIAAMVYAHLEFPGLRYGYGAIKKT